jgi:hypothetical protein
MKTIIDHSWRVILSSIVLYIVWILSMTLSENIIPSGLQVPEASPALTATLLFAVCFIHVIVLYIVIKNTKWHGIKMIFLIFLLIFFVQFFLSMIETIWFNDSLEMPVSGIKSLLFSGFILSAIFSPVFVWISGKMKSEPGVTLRKINLKEMISLGYLTKVLVLIGIFYPIMYNLAGYFIAWQFEAVRVYYTDSSAIEPFSTLFMENIRSGLYGFQIFRGLIWVILAIPVYYITEGSYVRKGILIGLVFAVLMNAQHMLPNPYFPREVAFAHFIETFISNFLWGFSIAWLLSWQPKRKLSGAL